MSQYPGGQSPYDPYHGRPPEQYAPPPQPSDPYFGQAPADPYAPPPQQPSDPYYGQAPADPYAQQAAYQAWQAQQQAYWQAPPQPAPARSRSGAGAVVAGIFLVLLGAWFLFRDQVSFDLGQTWPALAVGLGVVMVVVAFIPRRGY